MAKIPTKIKIHSNIVSAMQIDPGALSSHVYLLGKSKKGIIESCIRLSPYGGCNWMPTITANNVASGAITLIRAGYSPCGIGVSQPKSIAVAKRGKWAFELGRSLFHHAGAVFIVLSPNMKAVVSIPKTNKTQRVEIKIVN